MFNLYEHIETLAKKAGFSTVTQLCKSADVSPSAMTEIKKGRSQDLSRKTAQKFANTLHISIDEIYGRESEVGRNIDDDLKFALFGGAEVEITDEMYDEVKRFAAFVAQREKEKKKE